MSENTSRMGMDLDNSLSTIATTSESSGKRHVEFSSSCTVIPEHVVRRAKRTLAIKMPLYDDKKELVFKLPLPLFKKNSPSPSHPPASPCLVNSPNARHKPLPLKLSTEPLSLSAHDTLPSPVSPTMPSPSMHLLEVESIPLRRCCVQCMPATDACLAQGDEWVIAFSKGATRRRKGAVELKEVDEVESKVRRSGSCDLAPPAPSPPPMKVKEVVVEEEEDLFPLPSPRRSPASSPSSSSSLLALNSPSALPEDGILGSSLKRKDRCPAGLLCAENSSTSTLPSASPLPSPPVSPLVTPIKVPAGVSPLSTMTLSPSPPSPTNRSVSNPSASPSHLARASTFPASPKPTVAPTSAPSTPTMTMLPPTPESQPRPIRPRRRSSLLQAGKVAFAGALKGLSGATGTF